MTFRIAHAILALPVVCVLRLTFDVCAVSADSLVVSVNIVNVDDEPGTGRPR